MVQALGIDVGGSGIKAAPVDVITGELLAPRQRIPTPDPARPGPMVDAMCELVDRFDWSGAIGVGFPGVVQHGTVRTAANLHRDWVGTDLARVLVERLGIRGGAPVGVVNDADAAGLAEMRCGAGRDAAGVVMMITLGTGIGTAIFVDGILVPNTELGHLMMNGVEAEARASARAREDEGLSYQDWTSRLNAYLGELHRLLWPELFIIGGGISSKFEKYRELLDVPVEVVPAVLANAAGVVGAAIAATVEATAH
jgi:polyphosphate glucokinase